MRPKSLILLALALGCGLVASIGISQVMDRNANQGPAPVQTATIYVALTNIGIGDPIDASMVSLEEWPKDKIPVGAVTQLEELEDRRPRATIIEGEPILEGKLLDPGAYHDPIAEIPKGFRLKTISVDAKASAAGLLSPGDRVDVQLFIMRNERVGINQPTTKTILENIRVFAVDQTVQRMPDGSEGRTIAKTISLLLTPKQASRVTLAENLGSVSLIPRNPDDVENNVDNEATLDDLFATGDENSREKEQGRDGRSPQSDVDTLAMQTAPVDPPFQMEIVEGSDVRYLDFDPETGKPLRDEVSSMGGYGIDPYRPADGELPPDGSGGSGTKRGNDDFPIDLNLENDA